MGRRSERRRQYDLFCFCDKQVTARTRRILLISYHFPPSAAVGGQRIANFAKHLPFMGWEPHVLTIHERDIEQLDPDRTQGFQDVAIYRAGVLPTPISIWAAIRRRGRAVCGSERAGTVTATQPAGEGTRLAGKE